MIYQLIKYILCFIFVTMCFFNCDNKEKTVVNKSSEAERLPSQEGYDSELYITKAGVKQAVLHYGHMQKFDDQKIVYFNKGIELDFYDTQGEHTSFISAQKGEYHETTEDVVGRGNVVVVSDTGMTLFTEELRWDNEMNKFFSDTLVMITTREGDTLFGKGFESNPDLTRRVIYEPWGVSSEKVEIDKIKEEFIQATRDTVNSAEIIDSSKINIEND
jgi:LPS export ABC transporter protein LptC